MRSSTLIIYATHTHTLTHEVAVARYVCVCLGYRREYSLLAFGHRASERNGERESANVDKKAIVARQLTHSQLL